MNIKSVQKVVNKSKNYFYTCKFKLKFDLKGNTINNCLTTTTTATTSTIATTGNSLFFNYSLY